MMSAEAFSNMSNNNRQGRLGELHVTQQLVEAGGSVNDLTSSDYGFDLDYQLPLKDMSSCATEISWPLSSETVKIQVKTKKKKENGEVYPEYYPIDRARRLIISAYYGHPTFFMIAIVSDTPNEYTVKMIDLHDIDVAIKKAGSQQSNINLCNLGINYDSKYFVTMARLWCRFPAVCMKQGWQFDIDEFSKETEAIANTSIIDNNIAHQITEIESCIKTSAYQKVYNEHQNEGREQVEHRLINEIQTNFEDIHSSIRLTGNGGAVDPCYVRDVASDCLFGTWEGESLRKDQNYSAFSTEAKYDVVSLIVDLYLILHGKDLAD